MNTRDTGCLGLIAALAWSAVMGEARADDVAAGSPALQRATAERAGPPLPARARKPGCCVASVTPPGMAGEPRAARARGAQALSARAPGPFSTAPAGSSAETQRHVPGGVHEPSVRVELSPQSPAPDGPSAPAQAPGGGLTLSEAFGESSPLGVLSAVILPAARGVTIAEIQSEGTPAITLAVRPTKITRGSGLVAIGQF